MRAYLDTNIILFLLTNRKNELSDDVLSLIEDYGNIFLTSSVCLHEAIHLCQMGRVGNGKHHIRPEDVLKWIDDVGIQVVYTSRKHFEAYSQLPIDKTHRDPNDRLIIAQAISDKLPLVSSDHQFYKYQRCGLEFVFNQR